MLLIEIDRTTNKVLSAAQTDGDFVELPTTSYSLHVQDEELVGRIWNAISNGGSIFVLNDGTFQIDDVTPVDPEPVKTPEQLRIEQLERDNEQLMIAVADLYEQVLTLQGGL